MPGFDDHRNFAISTVATPPTPTTSGTVLGVAGGTGARFPAPPFNASIWPAGTVADPTNAEIVRVTAITTEMFTIARAQEGSPARAILVGDQIAATITDKTLTDIEASATLSAALSASAVSVLDRDITLADVVNSTTETTVYSATVAGGTLNATGANDGFVELLAQGEIVCTAATNLLVIQVKYGGVTFVYSANNITPISLTLPYALTIHAHLSASGAPTAQRGSGEIVLGVTGSIRNPPAGIGQTNFAQAISGNNALTIDSTVAQPLIITFQWGTAHPQASARLHTAHLLRGT